MSVVEWAVMVRTAFLALVTIAATAPATRAEPGAGSPDAKGTFIEPANAPHRHCSGSCLKSGTLHWFCKPRQTCSLDCGSTPPHMHCHAPRR